MQDFKNARLLLFAAILLTFCYCSMNAQNSDFKPIERFKEANCTDKLCYYTHKGKAHNITVYRSISGKVDTLRGECWYLQNPNYKHTLDSLLDDTTIFELHPIFGIVPKKAIQSPFNN